MEAAAKRFEQEEEIFQEIQHAKSDDDISPLSDMFLISEEDGYYPYCEIDFGLVPGIPVATQDESPELEQSAPSQPPFNSGREYFRTEMSDASLSCAASTLCSFLKPVESSSIPRNVRFSSLSSMCCLSPVLLFYSLALLKFFCTKSLEVDQLYFKFVVNCCTTFDFYIFPTRYRGMLSLT